MEKVDDTVDVALEYVKKEEPELKELGGDCRAWLDVFKVFSQIFGAAIFFAFDEDFASRVEMSGPPLSDIIRRASNDPSVPLFESWTKPDYRLKEN